MLSKDFLIWLKEANFPQNLLQDGQVWYDLVFERHGISHGNTLLYFNGGFTGFSQYSINCGNYLYQPTVDDFIRLIPSCRLEMFKGEPSVVVEGNTQSNRFTSDTVIESFARAYLFIRSIP